MSFLNSNNRFSRSGFPALDLRNEVVRGALYEINSQQRSLTRGLFTSYLPKYAQFRPTFELGCEVVHGIPSLYKGSSLGNLKIYIGRTTRETFAQNAFYKMQNGYDGMVAFVRCEMQSAKRFEKLYQAIVMKQAEKDALCVRCILNKRAHGGGPECSSEALIYIAWKISGAAGSVNYPCATVRSEIVAELYDDGRFVEILPGKTSIREALTAAKRLGTRQHLYWGKII